MIRAPLSVAVVSAFVGALAALSSCAGGEAGNALGITLSVEASAKPLTRCARVYVRPEEGPELLTDPLLVDGRDEIQVAVFRGELTESVTVGAHGYADEKCTGAAIVYAEEQTVRFRPERVENLSLRIRGRRVAEPLPGTDADKDGHAAPDAGGDCDDANASVHPGAAEICDNGIDDDCSGKSDCEDSACGAAPNCEAEPAQCAPRVCQSASLSEARACVYKPRPDFSACPSGVCRNGECTQAFPYAPSNFTVPVAGDFTRNVVLDCNARMTFNSTNRTFANWCPGAQQPVARVIQQPGGGEAVLLTMRGLTVAGAQTRVRFIGDLPVILAVLGDANISGALDVGSQILAGSVFEKGAGASPPACSTERGLGSPGTLEGNGGNQRFNAGSGGGGGAFGGPGAAGGRGGESDGGEAGAAAPANDALSPLRGGCAGGAGGAAPVAIPGGQGGGALQISVAGTLRVSGEISASGQGGRSGGQLDGGGGGGSGGALLLEATHFEATATAAITANGGGGGGGGALLLGDAPPQPGREGLERDVAPAPGGAGGGVGGGAGGAGGSVQAAPEPGGRGREEDPEGAGGGGGGGTGRIRIHGRGGSCRVETPVLSPSPVRAGACATP